MSLKHNQTSFGGHSDNSSRSTFDAGAVSALDEVTKRQGLLLSISFHDMNIEGVTVGRLLGIPPMRDGYALTPCLQISIFSVSIDVSVLFWQ